MDEGMEKELGAVPEIPDHELLREIGGGSYGVVWLARNIMGNFRAVKIVRREWFKDERPYEREFEGIKRYEPISRKHAGFVQILQIGRNDADGYFYYVMEAADDVRLGRKFQWQDYEPLTLEVSEGARTLEIEECLRVSMRLSEALHELHEQGLVHRDIKPSNIIMVDGMPKLADIGLVTEIGLDGRSFVGTEGYIPPEGPGTPQADVYSLGKVVYELSSGKDRAAYPALPTGLYEDPNIEAFLELNEIVIRACKTDVGERYETAKEMHAELTALADGKSIKRIRKLERQLYYFKRGAAIAAVLLFAFLTVGVFWQQKRALERDQIELANGQKNFEIGRNTSQGTAAIKEGNYVEALASFAELLKLEDTETGEDLIQFRIENALGQIPKLSLYKEFDGWRTVKSTEFSSDGNSILVVRWYGFELLDAVTGEIKASISSPWGAGIESAELSKDGESIWYCFGRTGISRVGRYDVLSGEFDEPFVVNYLPTSVTIDDKRERIIVVGDRDLDAGEGIIEIRGFDGKVIQSEKLESTEPMDCELSADGSLVGVSDKGGHFVLIEISKKGLGQQKQFSFTRSRVQQEFGWIPSLSFSPDGRYLAIAAYAHVEIWSLEGEPNLIDSTTLIHDDIIKTVDFSADSNLLLSASYDSKTKVLDMSTMRLVVPMVEHGQYIMGAAFAPDGHRFAVVGWNRILKVWDLAGMRMPFVADDAYLNPGWDRFALVYGPDVHVWSSRDPLDKPEIISFAHELVQINWVSDEHFLATLKLDESDGKLVTYLENITDGTRKVLSEFGDVALLPGKALLDIDGGRILAIDGNMLSSFGVVEQAWQAERVVLPNTGKDYRLTPHFSVLLREQRKLLLTGSKQVQQVDLDTFTISGFGPVAERPIEALAFNRELGLVACCPLDLSFDDCAGFLVSVETGAVVPPVLAHTDGVLSASFNVSSNLIVSTDEKGNAIVRQIGTSEQPGIVVVSHADEVSGSSFSENGKWIATREKRAGKIGIYDANNGDLLAPSVFSSYSKHGLKFAGKDEVLISANREGFGGIEIWNIRADNYSPEDIRDLVDVLRSKAVGADHSKSALNQENKWAVLAKRLPTLLTISEREIMAWHQLQAFEAEHDGRKSAALLHLNAILKMNPDHAYARRRLAAIEIE